MEFTTFREQLSKRIMGMTSDDQLRLALTICERLYPDYASFYDKYKWGNAELLLDAIRACEDALQGREDIQVVVGLRSRIDVMLPDTEEFGDYDGSCALNASAATAYTLQFVLDRLAENVLHAATLYYDTIDLRVNASGVSQEVDIDRHPMMEEARRFLLGQ